MNDQLESDLRAVLRSRAADVPASAVARLTHLDYHPRTRGLRPPLAAGALATAVEREDEATGLLQRKRVRRSA